MFVCDNSYMYGSPVLARVKGTTFFSQGTTLFSQEIKGQLRAREGRRDSFVPLWTKDGSLSFSLRRRTVYVQMCFMWYIVLVMCSLSNRVPIIDYLFLGNNSVVDKGKAPF